MMSEVGTGLPTPLEASPNSNAYKPSLRVDVSSSIKDESGAGITPKASQTPHVSTNIFVAGIPSTWDDEALKERYKCYGDIISTKVVINRHFGFVMFRRPESAHAAINATHLSKPTPTSTSLLHVSIAMHDEGVDDVPNDRIFVRGLPQWATKEHMVQCFSPFGTIVECAVLMNPQGQCKGSGFVLFSSEEEATAAVRAGRVSIHIDNWPHPLEVKYSETAEVRQLRQERNRNRQKNWTNSPKYPANKGSALPSPFAGFVPPPSTPLPLVPSPQGFQVVSSLYPILYPQPSAVVGASPHVPQPLLYSPQVLSPGMSLYPPPPPSMVMMNTAAIPQKGDLHLFGGPLTEDLIRTLLQGYGAIDGIRMLDRDGGAAVRMKDASQHAFVAQQLNGTLFSTGQLLSAILFA